MPSSMVEIMLLKKQHLFLDKMLSSELKMFKDIILFLSQWLVLIGQVMLCYSTQSALQLESHGG